MSDNLKAEKIAAAKKKLKQFQSKSKTETASNSTATSVGTESSQNANGNVFNENKLNECAHMMALPVMQSPPSTQLPESSQDHPPISLHFGAIDPIQFDSTRIFDRAQNTEQVFDMLSINPEIGVRTSTPSSTNTFNLNFSAPLQNVSTVAVQQSTNENISHFILDQTSPTTSTECNDIVYQKEATNIVKDLTEIKQHDYEIANLLQVEKVRNHELSVKVTQQHSTIEALKRELGEIRQCANATAELQQQINAHAQTVNILVGEKSDLTAKLQQKNQRIAEYESESVELQGRLKASRHRVSELEKDLNTLTQSHQKYDGSQQALCAELETLQDENKNLKRMHQEVCDENTEVQHQLTLKLQEIDELKNVISIKNSELEMARIRLTQLNGDDFMQPNGTPNTDKSQQDQRLINTERQIIELQNMISDLTNDRDRTQQQYQTYVQHLTNETTTMTRRIQELSKANEKLIKREESLVNHVQELEKQMQKQLSTQRRLAALRDDDKSKPDDTEKIDIVAEHSHTKDEINTIQEKLNIAEKEKSDLNALLQDLNTQQMALQHSLLEKDEKLTEIESELERLQVERPDTSNLLATIESDKVAASRAMAQNQELRQQLEEMQNAYVQVSNDKLELASQLQSEEYMNRDIRNRFGDLEAELKSIKEKLHFKDEEMIRLTHENAQFDSKIKELTQRLESSNNGGVKLVTEMQKKLHAANKEIKQLREKLHVSFGADECAEHNEINVSDICAHEHGNDHDHSHEHEHGPTHEHQDHNNDHCSHEHEEKFNNYSNNETYSGQEALDNSDIVSVTSTINIATNEAMDKLQERFKRTMSEIADLTEEKHRLEHLVTQLQSETETIGEYIALYQTQRRILKQREIEKDVQLNRIAADREDMRDKLHQLNVLVELLLTQKGFTNAKEIMVQLNTANNNNEQVPKAIQDKTPINGLTNSIDASTSDHANIVKTSDNSNKDSNNSVEVHGIENKCETGQQNQSGVDLRAHIDQIPSDMRETATKIVNLLTDIKDKNLRQDYTFGPNAVDHCSCCSGKLEVV